MRASQQMHEPWISPPVTKLSFQQYMERLRRDDHEGFAVCDTASDAIVGIINLNNIIRGSFLSCTLGYYAGLPYAGQGFMRDGLVQLIEHAFTTMGLHRLEANIQPDNARSIRLVEYCGFVREGLSRDYLFIDGQWRDHERWALVDARRALHSNTIIDRLRQRGG